MIAQALGRAVGDRLVRFATVPGLLALLLVGSAAEARAEPAAPTATALTASANPAVPGQPLTLSAAVTGRRTPAGTVTFSDYPSGPLQSAPLTAGLASTTLPPQQPGLHLLSADYGGGESNAPSSAQLTLRVGPPVASFTSVSVDRNPSAPGQAVTLAASVASAAGFGFASGTVTFRDGPAALGTIPLAALIGPGSGGAAPEQVSLTVPGLAPGLHSITASYSGDANLFPSTSAAWAQVVGEKVATATTIGSTANPSLSGHTTVLTANVGATVPTSRQPSGTLTFRDGATVLGTVPVVASAGSLPVALGGAGRHLITAVYSGDGDFQESASSGLAQDVVQIGGGPAPATVRVEVGSGPVIAGAPFGIGVAVVGAPGAGTPSGDVYVLEGPGRVLKSASLDAAGSATLVVPGLPAGPHRLTAVYSGNATFSHGSSSPLDVTVRRMSVVVALTSSANPAPADQEFTLTATVTKQEGGSPVATGSVSFSDRGTVLSTSAVDESGHAHLATALSAGRHQLAATFNGDVDHAGASAALVQGVGEPVPTTLSLRPGATRAGGEVSFTATVTGGVPGADVPGGKVIFRDGEAVIGTDELDERGIAAITVPALAPGRHSISARYAGDASFAPSGSTLELDVGPAPDA